MGAWGPQGNLEATMGRGTQTWPGDHNGCLGQPEGLKHNGALEHKGAWRSQRGLGTAKGPGDRTGAQGP